MEPERITIVEDGAGELFPIPAVGSPYRKWDLEPETVVACSECSWEVMALIDSAIFRGELHEEETGHRVRILLDRSSVDSPAIDLKEWRRG